MLNAILLLPLLTASTLILNNSLTVASTATIAISFMFLTFLFSAFSFYSILLNGQTYSIFIPLFSWFDLELFQIEFGGLFDTLSCIMLCVVTFVSLCVHIYSLEYMKNDPHLQRFLAYLSLFTFFMIVLVTSNNFIQLFMGWEGVGLCSYLLINFWYTRLQANKAAIKAVIVNRIGDTALAIAMCLTFKIAGGLDFDTVFALAADIDSTDINIICLFLFLGAMGKSAQLGLHTWLPDAMEGPTPVSALIHAATMVTAGVFLIIRCSHLFQEANYILPLMTIIGSLTTFFAATTALVQTDLKRVIAYSTCSQLGYMITACGLSAYNASLFHLSNHAFFKALLFLTAGSIIHAMSNEQDMRKMGGVLNLLPFSYSMILIASLALMGFPFLSGYYSKDIILETAYAHFSVSGHFAFWLGSLSAMFTSFYSMRLIFLTFLGEINSTKKIISKVHDAPILMALPMALLSIPSIFIGYLSKDIFIGLGSPFWGNTISYNSQNYQTLLNAEFLPFYIKIIPVCFSFFGTFCAIIYYGFFFKNFNVLRLNKNIRHIYTFLNKKWFIDKIYNEVLIQHFLSLGYTFTYKSLDRGFLEILGGSGFGLGLTNITKTIINFQNGLPFNYLRSLVMGVICIAFFGLLLICNVPFEILFFILLIILFF